MHILVISCLLIGLSCNAWSDVAYSPIALTPALSSQSSDVLPSSDEVDRLFPIPLHFVANHGQIDDAVFYYAKSEQATVYCTEAGITFGFAEGSVHLTFAGSRRVRPEARRELPGKVNYFIGNDPARWQTDIPTFQEVIYRDVVPGIDVVYDGLGRRLKYTCYLHAGADPDAIQMMYEGVDTLSLEEATGELALHTAWGIIRDAAPVAHQEIDGVQHSVDVAFHLLGQQQVGFVLGEYDANHPLVLDPGYSTYLGGSSGDVGLEVAIDGSGNAYIVGATQSSDFPTQGPVQGTHGGGTYDAFVTKLDSSGSTLVYSTYLGGNGDDVNFPGVTLTAGIDVDSSGDAYVTGMTRSTNFPLLNEYQSSFAGGDEDVFVTRLNSSGNALVYSTYLGGSNLDHAHDVTTDNSGYAYVTGRTDSTNFPVLNGFQSTHATGNSDDAFVTKLDTTQTGAASLLYSTFLGGTDSEDGFGITVDFSGIAYVVGVTGSTTGFPLLNAYQSTYGGGSTDAYFTKVDTTKSGASSLVYSSYLGGSGLDEAEDIVLDASGETTLTGMTSSGNFPLQNAFDSVLGGAQDAFVTRFNSTGSGLIYSTYLGGSNEETGASVDIDISGNAYVTGKTASSSDFPLQNAFQGTFGGGATDAFVTKLSNTGQITVSTYSTFLGGIGIDDGFGIAAYGSSAIVTGKTESTNFPLQNPIDSSLGGAEDAFVACYTSGGALPVELSTLMADISIDGVTLRWRTESETNNLGFNVYRSHTPDGPFVRINPTLIDGAGTDAAPHDYQFTDSNVESESVYVYYIEDVDYQGLGHPSLKIEVSTRLNTTVALLALTPHETRLHQNYPNPFNPETWMPYQLAQEATVRITVYAANGSTVRTLFMGSQPAGYYLDSTRAAYWDGRDEGGQSVGSGVYYYTIEADAFAATRKMLIVK